MPLRLIQILCLTLLMGLSGCNSSRDDGVVDAVVIGSPDSMFSNGVRLSTAGQQLRAATAEGLVAFDATGEVVPALADRWIITDDGQSYIFRLRDGQWPNGTQLSSESVRASLTRAISDLDGTSLGLDLSPITEVKAMTGRVIEIRLEGPVPGLLQLLAQPELGLRREGSGNGPMSLTRQENLATLEMLPPEQRGLPVREGWEREVSPIRLTAESAQTAIEKFDTGAADIVLNGHVSNLPLADTGALSRGTVRLDAAIGLFGLRVTKPTGLLSDASGRAAVALAIDRPALVSPFNIGGWIPTTRIVAPNLDAGSEQLAERWADLSLERRQQISAQRVANWMARNGGQAPNLKIAMPAGPGSDLLFRQISRDLSAVGIGSELITNNAEADLVLLDRLARFADSRWFLNQFNCGLNLGVCSPEADALVLDAVGEADPAQRAILLSQAEAELSRVNAFIPFGAPIRWSLVRGDVTGFATNRWGLHPLPPLALRPI